GSGDLALICDGLESDWRGLEEFGWARGSYSTQRPGGNPPGVEQELTVAYDRPVEVQTVRFIGGQHFTAGPVQGGWLQTITPQVLVGGQWAAPVIASAPTPSPASRFAILD